MTTNPGSDGWYYDERALTLGGSSRPAADVWTYGKEAWCNSKGQYVHIVADLSHLSPPYTMSICSIGVMGASYARNEAISEKAELT